MSIVSQDEPEDGVEGSTYVDPKSVARSAAQQERIIPAKWKPTVAEPVPVVRCTAIKPNGERCKRWSIRGATICYYHGGRLNNIQEHATAVVEAARMRLIGLSDAAVDQLEDLMHNASAEAIRLKAAQDVLDRAGVRGALEIEVTHTETESAADRVTRRLAEIAARNSKPLRSDEDIIDVEEVTEDGNRDNSRDEHGGVSDVLEES